jgi:hypothetical protein
MNGGGPLVDAIWSGREGSGVSAPLSIEGRARWRGEEAAQEASGA